MIKNLIIIITITCNFCFIIFCDMTNHATASHIITKENKIEKEKNIDSLKFSSENLLKVLKIYKVKNYHIVYKQAVLETGHFKSNMFKNNNNLFGMKHPNVRETTSLGPKNGHANYSTWIESVKDMVLFQEFYKKRLSSSKSYYDFLNGLYAEDTVGSDYTLGTDTFNVVAGVI